MVTIKLDGRTLHAPALDDKTRILHKPHLRIELNRPDALTFTVPPNHALFGQIQKRKGTVTVEIDGAEYFRGQVIDERPNINNMIEYTCEGMLSYLMDSIQRPYKIEEGAEIPVTELFGRLIENHNAQVETEKQFTAGTVNATDELIHTDSTDFATTLHEINLLCIGRYGGFLRVRRENNINYIDWLKELTDVCTQAVEFGENIIDIDGLIDTREVGSVLIPLGAQTKGKKLTIADVNGGSDSLESPELIAKYGRVVVTRDFPTIKDANELLNKGREALLEMEDDESFDITAVDLSCLGVNVSALRVGLLTPIRAPRHGIDKSKILYAADMDLENIENSVYTFGVPRQTLTEALAETARGGGAAGKKIEELKDIITDAYIDIDRLNGDILLRAYQDEMDTRFSEAWIDINGAKADLMLKADQETVDELSRTVTQAMIDIDGANAAILLKADTETVNALGERVSSAEVEIAGLEGHVEILVNKQVSLDQYENRLVSVESSVTTNAESIAMLSETVDDTGERLSGAELRIRGVEGSITTLTQKQEEIDGELLDLESSITQTAGSIELHSQSINELTGDMLSATVRINGVDSRIDLKADKTYVDDLFAESITAENLSASLSNLTAIINDSIQGNTGDFETVIAQGVQIGASGGLSVGGLNYSAHCHEIHVSDNGTVTFGAVTGTPQNFNVADTKAYKDGVSAAKASVTADVMGKWEPGGYKLITLSNDKTYGVWLPTFSASGGETFNDEFKTNVFFYANEVSTQPLKTVEVDASGVYEDGYKAGWAAAKAMIRHDQDDKRLFFGPSSVVDEEEQIFRVTVAAQLTGPSNSAKGVVSASAAARVYLDGTQILYANQSGTLNINAGML